MIAKFNYDAYHDAIVEELELFSNGLKCVFWFEMHWMSKEDTKQRVGDASRGLVE